MATNQRIRLGLTRDQLATFLKDPEQIKQFENLFSVANAVAPDVVNDVKIDAGTAQSAANVALDKIAALEHETFSNIALAENKANQALALLKQLAATVEGLQMAPPRVPPKRTRFGQFFDTTVQTAGAINTPTAITYNNTYINEGVYIGTPSSRIYVDTEGVYNFLFSIQLDKASGGIGIFWVWPRINGVDVANSNSQVRIQGNNAEQLVTAGYFFDLKAGDYVEFMFAVDDISVHMEAFAASAFYPAIPSIILTVTDNIRSYPS